MVPARASQETTNNLDRPIMIMNDHDSDIVANFAPSIWKVIL